MRSVFRVLVLYNNRIDDFFFLIVNCLIPKNFSSTKMITGDIQWESKINEISLLYDYTTFALEYIII